MASISKKVANWLYSVLQPQYLHKELAFNDIYRFLSVYLSQGFKIRTAVYTSQQGNSNLLVNLYGSLNCKNIEVPLNIWVPLNYPFADNSVAEPNGVPIVYVVATPDMLIRPGNNVDLQGRFYHPYLSSWHSELLPGSSNAEYNLLNLMSCLITTFNKDSPLQHPPVTSGPELPPKPAALSPNNTGFLRRETNGPPLPQKPGSTVNDGVPLKYRSPLPLPSQNTGNGDYANRRVENIVPGFTPTQQSPYRSDTQLIRSESQIQMGHTSQNRLGQTRPEYQSPPHSTTTSPPHSFVNYSSVSPGRGRPSDVKTPTPTPRVGVSEIEDLMDKVTLDDGASTIPREILEQISAHINNFLSSETPDNANSIIGKINENSHRIQALYSQLEHHNKQAAANKENLDKHIKYLQGQVSGIQKLNSELAALDKMNTSSVDEIYTSTTGQKLNLEDIITPDSKLVHQLYDVTADIKACKDTLKLLGSGLKGEEEMINDGNLDTCVKAARGLGRELFWLEVTKQQIAKTMGLST